jgi:hypothetical protein
MFPKSHSNQNQPDIIKSPMTYRQELELQKAQFKEQISRCDAKSPVPAYFSGTRRQYLEHLTTRIALINSELKRLLAVENGSTAGSEPPADSDDIPKLF